MYGNIQIGNNNNQVRIKGFTIIDNMTITNTTTDVISVTLNHLNAQEASGSIVALPSRPSGPSSGAGIYIADSNNVINGVNDGLKAAYMIISEDRTGFLFKTAPSNTVLNMNIANIGLTNATNGLVGIQRTTTGTLDSSYTMVPYDIDVSNLLIRNGTSSTNSLQTISTDVTIDGNIILNKNVSIGGNIIVNKSSIFPNMVMDISGNVAITRLGLNQSSINNDATLAVQGNIIQTSGFIQQF